MFCPVSLPDMAVALDKIQKAHCGYGGGRCDCKYGTGEMPSHFVVHGEHNGCPELRAIARIVAVMTEDEWADLKARAGLV